METQELQAPLGSAAPLSGDEIIECLCHGLVTALRDHPDLRPTDSHERFSAKIEIQLTLHDVDPKKIEIKVEIPPAPVREVRERSKLAPPSLERPTSPDAQTGQPVTRARRWYTPRQKVS